MNTHTPPRKPYDLIHPNMVWSFTMPRGYYGTKPVDVVANFQLCTDLTDGKHLLIGRAIDEYGWWHGPVRVALESLPELERVGYGEPEPAPFPVTVGFDWRAGLVRLQIPDDVARRLRAWSRAHWHEYVGMGDGYSDSPKRGTWEHRTLAYLHSVQSHLTDDMPFIEGESMHTMRDAHGHLPAAGYDLLVTTCGVKARSGCPTSGFHFTG